MSRNYSDPDEETLEPAVRPAALGETFQAERGGGGEDPWFRLAGHWRLS